MASQPYLGAIFIFAGNFAPRGYMLCQGQLLAISQNAALFSILGTTYGGNGVQTFALPDLRGRAPIGQGTGPGLSNIVLGEMVGTQNATILTSNLPAHTHALNASNAPGAEPLATNNLIATPQDSNFNALTAFNAAPPNTTMAPNAIGLTGSNIPISIQNPILGINYIIAVQGIFPSRS
jgi:microcystin-dependent protein